MKLEYNVALYFCLLSLSHVFSDMAPLTVSHIINFTILFMIKLCLVWQNKDELLLLCGSITDALTAIICQFCFETNLQTIKLYGFYELTDSRFLYVLFVYFDTQPRHVFQQFFKTC